MALGQWILHREVQKAMGTLGTHHRSSPEQPKLLQRQHQLSNSQKLQICKNAAVQQQSELKAHNLLQDIQKTLSVCIFFAAQGPALQRILGHLNWDNP